MGDGFVILVGLAVYVFVAYLLFRIANKFRSLEFWRFLIPFYNMVLMCRCAQLSGWFVLVFLIPYLGGLVFSFVVYGRIAKRLGHNFWLFGVLSLIFCISLLILAFESSTPVQAMEEEAA